MRFARLSSLAGLILLIGLWTAPAFSQGCAMCRANAKATPKDGQKAINRAILVMIVPPVSMATFGAAFIVRYVRRRDQDENRES